MPAGNLKSKTTPAAFPAPVLFILISYETFSFIELQTEVVVNVFTLLSKTGKQFALTCKFGGISFTVKLDTYPTFPS
ncbi:hypothetical protein D3C85_664250 [compost metagenome]